MNTKNISNVNNVVSSNTHGLYTWGDRLIDMLPNIVIAVIILILSVVIAKMLKKYTEDMLIKTGTKIEAQNLVGKAIYGIILIIGISTTLNIIGIETTFVISALGVGLGFAFKDILANYIAGIFLVFNDMFKLGDLIEVNGQFGYIQEIGSRNITIKNLDGQRVSIPNSTLVNEPFKNYTHYPERRITLDVGVSYRSDLPKAAKAVYTILVNHPKVLKKPEPSVNYYSFNAYSINMYVRFWIPSNENWFAIQSQIIEDIKYIFNKINIQIPFPITTLKTDPGEEIEIKQLMMKNNDFNSNNIDNINQNSINQNNNKFDTPNQNQGNNIDYLIQNEIIKKNNKIEEL